MMSDPRLDILKAPMAALTGTAIRIEKIRIEGYRFFASALELPINGKNLLLYGENGTGKSSIYRALGLLARKGLGSIAENRNIFSETPPSVEFEFSTGQTLTLDSDSTDLPLGFEFLKPLAVFVPLLDYKRLLRVHFSSGGTDDRINIYSMLRDLFSDYPIEGKDKISDIKYFQEYFRKLEEILNGELLGEINELIKVFDKDFSVERFNFTTEVDDAGRPNPIVSISIDYRDKLIEKFHLFLNEARLSALAIALYFASIRRISAIAAGTSFRILVLDDLLISLDMGNRLKLLEILKTKFEDFQVFFFTHDKSLYDLYREKMDWACYELYLDDLASPPGVIITTGKTDIEHAKKSYSQKDFPACAVHLRTGFEKLLKSNLSPGEQRNKKCEALNLAGLTSKLTTKSQGEVKTILERLDSDRTHILNPLCHDDSRTIHSEEIRTAIRDLERLTELLQR